MYSICKADQSLHLNTSKNKQCDALSILENPNISPIFQIFAQLAGPFRANFCLRLWHPLSHVLLNNCVVDSDLGETWWKVKAMSIHP